MPPVVLTSLKWLFLALLYLFIARAVRVIHLDLVGTRAPRPAAGSGKRRHRGTPRTILVREPDQPAKPFPLRAEVVIGREDSCQVVLQDTYCSQMHARLFAREGAWFVEDLGSTNGTYLNRMKVTGPSPIADGDEVRVGKTLIEVRR
ncbi:MAG: FHA domain-containing protein [Acidobacteria bacterium]|nr:FHA domain-containing protein [Acidobacteriota bacterium]